MEWLRESSLKIWADLVVAVMRYCGTRFFQTTNFKMVYLRCFSTKCFQICFVYYWKGRLWCPEPRFKKIINCVLIPTLEKYGDLHVCIPLNVSKLICKNIHFIEFFVFGYVLGDKKAHFFIMTVFWAACVFFSKSLKIFKDTMWVSNKSDF